jgi:hypothetical protein
MPAIPAQVRDLIPTGCTVVDYPNISTVHSPSGDLVAIVCGVGAPNRARLIATIPVLFKSAENALDNSLLSPLAHGLDAINGAVFPRLELPVDSGKNRHHVIMP